MKINSMKHENGRKDDGTKLPREWSKAICECERCTVPGSVTTSTTSRGCGGGKVGGG